MIINHNGRYYAVKIERDDYVGAPWVESDGHGPVSDWTARAKLPGERVLATRERFDGTAHRYYDYAKAIGIAKRDGWDAPPYGGTAGEKAARAVERDFEHLRGWCRDEWHWSIVTVTWNGYSQCLGGIESGDADYLQEVALELIEELESMLHRVTVTVNQWRIKSNAEGATNDPVICVNRYRPAQEGFGEKLGDTEHHWSFDIPAGAKAVYDPINKTPCGASCWVEFTEVSE